MPFGEEDFEITYQRWIQSHLHTRVLEYSTVHSLKVFCGTWNVNARRCDSQGDDLSEWLLPNGCDIYALSLQEIVPLNVTNVVISSEQTEEAVKYWIHLLYNLLNYQRNSDGTYVLLREEHMSGLMIAIFVKESILPNIKDIRSVAVRTGMFHVLGNKGGLAIRMTVFDSNCCFVGCHFHASANAVAARNMDYTKIVTSSSFPPQSDGVDAYPSDTWNSSLDSSSTMCIDPASGSSCMAATPDSVDTVEITTNAIEGRNGTDEAGLGTDDVGDAAKEPNRTNNTTTEMSNQTSATSISSSTTITSSFSTRIASDYWKVSLEKFLNIHKDRTVSILDHEFVFWMGDLNYRISGEGNSHGLKGKSTNDPKDGDGDDADSENNSSTVFNLRDIDNDSSKDRYNYHNLNNNTTTEMISNSNPETNRNSKVATIGSKKAAIHRIMSACSKGRFQSFAELDQLTIERRKNTVFHGFQEGPLVFPPTYKYQPGTEVYESRGDKKLRAPAWCDRVLWKVSKEEKSAVTLLHYGRAEVHCSDHKPVRAFFQCAFRSIELQKMKEMYENLLKSVDDWINTSRPKLDFDLREINFGLIRCYEKITKTISFRNTGNCMLEWQFVPKFNEERITKRGMSLHPIDGILAPNESVQVEATILLDATSAWLALSQGSKQRLQQVKFEDILVLRVHKGSDYFLVVEANLEEDEENIRQQYKKYVLPPISTPSPSPPPPPQVRSDSDELFQHELIL